MQRRDFLKQTGLAATGLAAAGITRSKVLSGEAAGAADASAQTAELSTRRIASDRVELAFQPRQPRPLRILQITDTHFGNPDDNHRRRDERSYELIRKLVEQEGVDFVAHTGDFVNNDRGRRIHWEAVDFMDSLGVPWTHALGNHDIGPVPVDEFWAKSKGGLFGQFEHDGKRHYAFRFDVRAAAEQPAFSIFVFDSGFKHPRKFVAAEQLQWFERQMESDRQAGSDCPAVALIHIPVVEFERMRQRGDFSGIYGETVCCETDQGETFARLGHARRVKAIFSGHDHENDYRGRWEGLELVYGRVTGHSGYGDLERGGRLIEIDPVDGTYRHRLVFVRA